MVSQRSNSIVVMVYWNQLCTPKKKGDAIFWPHPLRIGRVKCPGNFFDFLAIFWIEDVSLKLKKINFTSTSFVAEGSKLANLDLYNLQNIQRSHISLCDSSLELAQY